MSEPFDENALMDRVDGDVEFLEDTIGMLGEDGPGLLEAVRNAVTARDAEALAKSAHALKGMLSNFCAEPAEAAARELEAMGREERLENAEDAAATVERETERLVEALSAFLRTKQE
jgi:HPt (histidine-containing phosphotransfer) domain-containing protein